MPIRERVAKIASGVSVDAAARAWERRADGHALDGEEQSRAEELDATVEAMFLMAAVDGTVTQDEVAQLAASLQAVLDVRGRGGKLDVEQMLVELSRRLEREGWTARLDQVARRLGTEEARTFAFRLAAAVAFVDDHVAHAEAAAIDAFTSAFDLTSETADALLHEVRDSLFGT
jgi:hypothetical protein